MKYLTTRDKFLKYNSGISKYQESKNVNLDNKKEITEKNIYKPSKYGYSINEVFKNFIAFGDTLLGRVVNSLARGITNIVKKRVRVPLILKDIKNKFDYIISKNRNIQENLKQFLILIGLLQQLEKAVYDKEPKKDIIKITEDTIVFVEGLKISNTNDIYSINQKDKDVLLERLKDFLNYLLSLNDPTNSTTSNTTAEQNDDSDSNDLSDLSGTKNFGVVGIKYTEMRNLLIHLKNILKTANNTVTRLEADKKENSLTKDISSVYNKLLNVVKQNSTIDHVKNNNLFAKGKGTNDGINAMYWPLISLEEKKIMYRRVVKLIEITDDGMLLTSIPKWDSTNNKFVGSPRPRKLDYNNKNINLIINYLINQTKTTDKVLSNGVFTANKAEIDWFNRTYSKNWAISLRKKNSKRGWIKFEIGEIKDNGAQLTTNINYEPYLSSLLNYSFIYKGEKDADSKYQELYDSEKLVFTNKDELVRKDKTTGKAIKESATIEPIEKHATQAWNKLKNVINSLKSKDGGLEVTIELLDQIAQNPTKIEMSPNDSEESFKKRQKELKRTVTELCRDIKKAYESTPDPGKLYENITITMGQKQSLANMIGRFARYSMKLEGEGLYGELGDAGNHLKKFNETFQLLLNADFSGMTNEGILIGFKQFTKINSNKYNNLYESLGSKVANFATFTSGTNINEYSRNKYQNLFPIFEGVSDDIIDWYDSNFDIPSTLILSKNEISEFNTILSDSGLEDLVKVDSKDMLDIINLISNARNLYFYPTFPTDRGEGKIANFRVKNNYDYLGDSPAPRGNSVEGGPWRHKGTFQKYIDGLNDILSDPEISVLFKDNTSIVLGSGQPVKGGGKLILNFIRELNYSNGDNYNSAMSNFMRDYYNLKIEERGDTYKATSKTTQQSSKNNTSKDKDIMLTVKEVGEINLKDNRSFYIIEYPSGNKGYLYIVENEGKFTYVKYSKNFFNFSNYIKSPYKIENSVDVSKLIDPKKYKTDSDVRYGQIDRSISDRIKPSNFKLNSFSLKEFNSGVSKVQKKAIDIISDNSKIYKIVEVGTDKFNLPSNLRSSNSQVYDSSDYNVLRDKFII